jgi:hypothetical protein
VCLYFGGAAASVVFIVVASGFGDAWTWDQARSLANVIVGRITNG